MKPLPTPTLERPPVDQPPSEGEACPALPSPRRQAAIAAVLAAMVLAVLDAAIVNVALPSLAQSLDIAPTRAVWIITAYQAALVMGLLPCAALGESLGYRRVFALGVALFTAASGLCAMAPTLDWLVMARALQGLGAAAIMALGIALLRLAVPQSQLGAAIGWNALAVALPSAVGPTLGAVILSIASWPWLFAINLPLGVMVLLACRALPQPAGTARPLDGVSVTLNAVALAGLVIGAEVLLEHPATAAGLLIVAAVCLVALYRREMPKVAPLIPLDLLRSGSFRTSVIASVCCFSGMTMGILALPFHLQHSLGQNTLMTGLYMTPWPLTVAIMGPVAGRLADRVSTGWLCAAGGVCLAAALAAAALWPSHDSAWQLVPITMLCGLGFGLFQVPNNRNMFLSAPRERTGAAGGMQATARLAGQTAGGVAMSLLFTLASTESAPQLGLGIGSALTLAAGLISVLRVRP